VTFAEEDLGEVVADGNLEWSSCHLWETRILSLAEAGCLGTWGCRKHEWGFRGFGEDRKGDQWRRREDTSTGPASTFLVGVNFAASPAVEPRTSRDQPIEGGISNPTPADQSSLNTSTGSTNAGQNEKHMAVRLLRNVPGMLAGRSAPLGCGPGIGALKVCPGSQL